MLREVFRGVIGSLDEGKLPFCGGIVLYHQKVFGFPVRCGCGQSWFFSEALLRWYHPLSGVILPLKVLPRDDRFLMCKLTRFVLFLACQIAVREKAQVDLAVNVPAFFLEEEKVIEAITGVLKSTGFEPENLILEITEDFPMSEKAFEVAKELIASGVRFAIDGFGEGFASLMYLLQGVFSFAKIDMNFFRKSFQAKAKDLLQKILFMLDDAGVKAVVEGVEVVGHEEFLMECVSVRKSFFVQGFLYHKPEVWGSQA